MDKKTHDGRPDLAGEHPLGDAGQLILFLVFMAVWISDSFIFQYSTVLHSYIPLSIRIIIAATVLLLSVYLAKKGHDIIFSQNREEATVINEGIFRIVRHPLYLGSITFYLGLLILTLSVTAIIVWILIVVFYNYIAIYEEKILIERFGKNYQTYMEKVSRWIPL